MMASEHIISVTESDFEYEVIEYSKQIPVIVDFWAEWCGPCRTLGPILERLTQEAGGAFRLAKVDVDKNPNLALRYSIRSIPNVKAFRDGQLVAEFAGSQPESRIREFLKSIAPSEHDLALEKALSLLDEAEWESAERTLREYLNRFPNNPAALFGLARSLLADGFVEEPAKILSSFPASKEYHQAETLNTLAKALLAFKNVSGYSDEPKEAAYFNALRLIRLGNFEAAMDGMLDILRQDKRFRNDEVRKIMLAMFELLGPKSPLTRQYQNELAMVLF
jgi:putative thioredoxin